jgi:hypothetical protein
MFRAQNSRAKELLLQSLLKRSERITAARRKSLNAVDVPPA